MHTGLEPTTLQLQALRPIRLSHRGNKPCFNRLKVTVQKRSSLDQRAHNQAAGINLHFLTRRDGVMLRDARGVPRDEGLLTSRAQALLQARGHN